MEENKERIHKYQKVYDFFIKWIFASLIFTVFRMLIGFELTVVFGLGLLLVLNPNEYIKVGRTA